MQVLAEKRDVVTGGVTAMKQFTVKAGPHIMSILSGLYANPVDAMVREYLTNMWDAYVALKKISPNCDITPPELHLPNSLDPNLIFKDYGVGMDYNTVWNIFTSYGDSTKSDSDDEVGGFGLGSKTAFCYNNGATWNIESRYNGEKHVFMAFINSDGAPNVVHVTTEPTDEHNGVTISIPIKRDDIKSVLTSAEKYIPYFPMKLNITGVEMTQKSPVRDLEVTPEIFVNKRGSSYSFVRIVMGNVPYTITSQYGYWTSNQNDPYYKFLHKIDVLKNASNFIYGNAFEFIVNVGDVDIVPSRDALKLTDKTVAKIESMFVKMFSVMENKVSTDLDNCATEWDALPEFDKYNKIPGINKIISSFKYKGTELTPANGIIRKTTDLQIMDADVKVGVYGITSYSRSTVDVLPHDELKVKPGSNTYIIIDDVDKGSVGLTKGFLRSKLVSMSSSSNRPNKHGHTVGSGILIETSLSTKQLSSFFGGYPESDMILLSSLVGTITPLKATPVGNVYKLRRYSYTSKFVSRVTVPVSTDKKYYVPMIKLSGDTSYSPELYCTTLLLDAFHDKLKVLVGTNVELYGIRKNEIADLDSTWINANDIMISFYKKILIDESTARKSFIKDTIKVNQYVVSISHMIKKSTNDIKIINDIVKFTEPADSSADTVPWEALNSPSLKDEVAKYKEYIGKFAVEWSELVEEFYKKFPMIKVITSAMLTNYNYTNVKHANTFLANHEEVILNYIEECIK